MTLPSLGQGASLLATTALGAFGAYIVSQCAVTPLQLVEGGGMAVAAAVAHLYMTKPGTVKS